MTDDPCLQAERILIDGQKFRIRDQVQRLLWKEVQVAAQQDGRRHDAPEPEVSLFLAERKASVSPLGCRLVTVSHYHHVHIVIVA